MTHPYADSRYASAFMPAYEPLLMPSVGLHVLKRPIPGSDLYDAMGPYPLSPLRADADLEADFDHLRAQGIVSLVLVSDPFFHPSHESLAGAFDTAALFKEHYIYDFAQPQPFSSHHRYEIRRAAPACDVRVIDLAEHMDAWYALYAQLIEKHHITGIQAFTRSYFEQLCALDPIVVGAFSAGKLVSAHIWLMHEGYVYSHLAASSDEGYKLRAAYVVYDYSITHFTQLGAHKLDFGAGAGVNETSQGLTFLKKGFSTGRVPCYLCCKILDEVSYAALSRGKASAFFPAYRGA